MSDPVELGFHRAMTDLVGPGTSLLVAASGGGDSMALLHLLRGYAPRHSIRLVVGHLDHGLRPDSASDEKFVRSRAEALGLTFVGERRPVPDLRRKSESPEEAARRVRREFLAEAAAGTGCAVIATGHNLDDQAETVLMRLVRGAGTTALAGMTASGPGPFVRPLLGLEREALREYARRRGIDFRDDPTNAELEFDRNRVRRLVLPFIGRTLNPRAARHLVQAAERLREDALLLDEMAENAFKDLVRQDPAGCCVMDSSAVAALSPPIARRVLRLALRRAGADGRRIGSRHLESMLDLARGGGGRRLDLPSGIVAHRDRRRLVVGRHVSPDV